MNIAMNLHKKVRIFRVSNFLKKESFDYSTANADVIWCRQGTVAVDEGLDNMEWSWPDSKYAQIIKLSENHL